MLYTVHGVSVIFSIVVGRKEFHGKIFFFVILYIERVFQLLYCNAKNVPVFVFSKMLLFQVVVESRFQGDGELTREVGKMTSEQQA